MDTKSCFPFPSRTDTGVSLLLVWTWHMNFLTTRNFSTRKAGSDTCSTPGIDQPGTNEDSSTHLSHICPHMCQRTYAYHSWAILWVIQLDNHIAQKDAEPFQGVLFVQWLGRVPMTAWLNPRAKASAAVGSQPFHVCIKHINATDVPAWVWSILIQVDPPF